MTADGPTTVSTLLRSGHGLLLELGPPSARPTHVHPRVERVAARAVDSPVGSALGAGPGVDRVLVRPDGYVCWAGAGPDASPEAALGRWFGTAAVPVTASGAVS